MNTKGHYIASSAEFWSSGASGDWSFMPDGDVAATYILIHLPVDSGANIAVLPIRQPPPDAQSQAWWGWNGSTEAPSLTPSILHHSVPAWHGYMTDGELISV